ncbi:branched-chain amino acid aminotransferase [Paraphaeosphaeria minitans]|uniref:Branched-chain-amino-acid aminotransferase n=1 Tax=Paraphaeosphaeria minitans TaxID=565426 RepID=A0A9P6GMX6_9PLEO|nr:branched-chain amino acid aminotransferase [Paraphaeosphaeria minitans]
MAPGIVSPQRSFEHERASSGPAGLDASKLRVTKTLHPTKLPPAEDLTFGSHHTDHILQVQWTSEHGWQTPQIAPYQHLSLDPAAAVLHYGFECFEGMKAYRDVWGSVRLFRPEINLDRLNRSAARIALPTFDADELLKLIARFVQLEERFIYGRRKSGYSLYIRPVIIATNSNLGVAAPTSALLYCIACPVGPYFPAGFKAINLEATNSVVATRAWPGGAGNHKIGGNYAPCIAPEKAAKARGFQQLLWLFGDDDRITEAGTMNLFIVLRTEQERCFELITPPLDGMILPGVTRDCVLSLARERLAPLGWTISEREICMSEVVDAAGVGKLVEVFGTGTAAVVSPIRSIKYRDTLVQCGLSRHQSARAITTLFKEWIEARQYAVEEHPWSVPVSQIK